MALTTTPNPVDFYSRYMAEMFDERDYMSVPTGFQAFFGNPANNSKTYFSDSALAVEIDILRANEKTAALIPRGGVGRTLNNKALNQQNYTSFTRVFPLAEDILDINSSQLDTRVAGEGPYEQKRRLDRMRLLASDGHKEIIRRMTRLFERLAAQSVLEGVQDAILGTTNTDLQYDFKRNSNLLITVANAWNSGSQTIMEDVDGACDVLRSEGHVTPDMMVVGGNAMNAIINDAAIQKLADNRRFGLINIDLAGTMPTKYQRFIDSGFEWRGFFLTSKGRKLYLFTYTDVYDDDSGDSQNYMPEDQALICYSGARADRYFGPEDRMPLTSAKVQWYQDMFGFSLNTPPMPMKIKNQSAIIDPAMFRCDAYESNDGKTVSLRTQSAPIFATTRTDAFATLKGLIA